MMLFEPARSLWFSSSFGLELWHTGKEIYGVLALCAGDAGFKCWSDIFYLRKKNTEHKLKTVIQRSCCSSIQSWFNIPAHLVLKRPPVNVCVCVCVSCCEWEPGSRSPEMWSLRSLWPPLRYPIPVAESRAQATGHARRGDAFSYWVPGFMLHLRQTYGFHAGQKA